MNIFVLEKDPKRAAETLCDKHAIKMVLETAQMLSTCIQVTLNVSLPSLYKVTHKNHPDNIWIRSSIDNFRWLVKHGLAMSKEYTARYGKVHASQSYLETAAGFSLDLELYIPSNGLTVPPKCMPDHCKVGGDSWEDVIASYRNYYHIEKAHFATWKRNKPNWYIY